MNRYPATSELGAFGIVCESIRPNVGGVGGGGVGGGGGRAKEKGKRNEASELHNIKKRGSTGGPTPPQKGTPYDGHTLTSAAMICALPSE